MKIVLHEMNLTNAESKATYEEIKAYVLEKHGFKVKQLYFAQVKRKHGIIERVDYKRGRGQGESAAGVIGKGKGDRGCFEVFPDDLKNYIVKMNILWKRCSMNRF